MLQALQGLHMHVHVHVCGQISTVVGDVAPVLADRLSVSVAAAASQLAEPPA